MSDPNADPPAPPTGAASYKDDPEFLPWLKTQEGFADLFAPAGPKAPTSPAPVATGGGQTVPANQSADAMSKVVTDVTQAIAKGAVAGAAEAVAKATGAAPAPATAPEKKGGFWGR